MGEELRAIDADHFWIGEYMVDLVALRYEANKLASRPERINHATHQMGQSLIALDCYAESLMKGRPVDAWKVKYSLRNLNRLGLHTGYVERKENTP